MYNKYKIYCKVELNYNLKIEISSILKPVMTLL